jgi:hypothetical protein
MCSWVFSFPYRAGAVILPGTDVSSLSVLTSPLWALQSGCHHPDVAQALFTFNQTVFDCALAQRGCAVMHTIANHDVMRCKIVRSLAQGKLLKILLITV